MGATLSNSTSATSTVDPSGVVIVTTTPASGQSGSSVSAGSGTSGASGANGANGANGASGTSGAGGTNGSSIATPVVTPCPDTCAWYQTSTVGTDGRCACSFSLINTAQTLFLLPGSVVAGFMVKPEPGNDRAILSQNMMILATAISLAAWGGLGYYLWRRFR